MSSPATTRLKVNPPVGQLPVLQYCSPDQLLIDDGYQRRLEVKSSQTLIRKIAMFWDWGLCQPLFVARRADGGLYVVDGQHRLAAARLRDDIWQLPCVVTSFRNAEEEAASFVALNQQRQPLNRMQLFKAARAAGDENAASIQAALDEAGLWIGSSPDLSMQKPGAIVCIAALEHCLRIHGAGILCAALDVLAQSYKEQILRYAGTLFPGIVALVASEVKADPNFANGDRFALMTEMIGGATQSEWVSDINLSVAAGESGNKKTAAIAVFEKAWGECNASTLDEAA